MTADAMKADDVLLVLTQLPEREAALKLARVLIDSHLAACAQVLAASDSVYRWQGAVETSAEWPMLIKTTRERYPQLETKLRELHPYELPEIIAVPVAQGLPAYLQWVADETQDV